MMNIIKKAQVNTTINLSRLIQSPLLVKDSRDVDVRIDFWWDKHFLTSKNANFYQNWTLLKFWLSIEPLSLRLPMRSTDRWMVPKLAEPNFNNWYFQKTSRGLLCPRSLRRVNLTFQNHFEEIQWKHKYSRNPDLCIQCIMQTNDDHNRTQTYNLDIVSAKENTTYDKELIENFHKDWKHSRTHP